MNLYQLRYFAELAQEQHYTNAAQNLNISQPSLSHAISQLEDELGVKLFEKVGRGTRLTGYGNKFLQYVKHALSILDNGVEEMRRYAEGQGLIRLGFLNQLGVDFIPGLASRYLTLEHNQGVQFTFHADRTPELLEGLKLQKYDLVFCAKPVDSEDLSCVPISRQELVLIVHQEHPLAAHDEIRLEDTLEYPYIFFNNDTGLRPVINELFDKIGEFPKIAYETEEEQVIFGLVSYGFGIAVTPYREMLKKLNVKVLTITHPVPIWEGNIYMIADKQTYVTPAVKNFRDFILQQLLT